MKPLLTIAFVSALSLTTGACTVVTDPSSGSSSGSSSESAGFLDRQQQIAEFTTVNLERLKNDMAAGQGEYLSALAALLNVAPANQPAFFAFTQGKFTALFPNDRTTAAEMLTALSREMRADPRFGQRLALN